MARLSATRQRLLFVCRRRGASREDARDMVQEAYMRLLEYQRRAKVRDPDSLLRRIVLNASINHYHREQTSPIVPETLGTLDRRGNLVDPMQDPERLLAAEQELDRVVKRLDALSPRTCQIFIAQRGGYSYEEIAAAFAVKPRTVEKHVANAAWILNEAFAEAAAEAQIARHSIG